MLSFNIFKLNGNVVIGKIRQDGQVKAAGPKSWKTVNQAAYMYDIMESIIVFPFLREGLF